jgi:hypothetical protein
VNRVFVVTQGIAREPDAPWFVAEQKPNGSLRRVRSPKLPMRATQREAEDDLAAWLGCKVHLQCPAQAKPYMQAYQELIEKHRKEEGIGTGTIHQVRGEGDEESRRGDVRGDPKE